MKVPEVFKLPVADQLTDLVDAVYALEETFRELQHRSSHIIASGEVSEPLMTALSELNGSLNFALSVAGFVHQETKPKNEEPQP